MLLYAYYNRSGSEGVLAFQVRCGIASVVRWKLRPVIFGVALRPFGAPEESKKSPERVRWDTAPKVPKECAPESRKSPKRVKNLTLGLFLDAFETPLSARLGPYPGVLFPDSFWTELRADFWEGDGDEALFTEKKGFSVNWGEAIQ